MPDNFPASATSMKRLPRLLPAALLAALLGVAAAAARPSAQTYRIVGPDGKVTFSDRKPTDPQAARRASSARR